MLPVPNCKLDLHIDDPRVRQIVDALNISPFETKLVGGAVRDALLSRQTKDLDFATTASPDEVIHVITDVGLKPQTMGIAFGTVACSLPSGYTLEITQLRRDIEPDGRHTKIQAINNWREDAKRRDFTMNALYADLDGTLYDPLGTGFSDVNAGRVSFIGNAHGRIQEDYLRILRFYRFQAHFGLQPANKRDLQAITDNLSGLRKVSRERIKSELHSIFKGPYSTQTAELLLDNGILPCVFNVVPQCFDKIRINRAEILFGYVRELHPEFPQAYPFFQAIYAMTIPTYQDKVYEILDENLNLSRVERQYLSRIGACLENLVAKPLDFSPLESGNLYAYIHTHGKDILIQSLIIHWIDDTILIPQDNQERLRALLGAHVPHYPLQSMDITQALPGINGKELGSCVRAGEEWWLGHNCIPDKSACLSFIVHTHAGA